MRESGLSAFIAASGVPVSLGYGVRAVALYTSTAHVLPRVPFQPTHMLDYTSQLTERGGVE